MSQQLRDALHDLADEAGVAHVDDRTFARARTARRRRRGAGIAAGMLALGLLGTALTGTLRSTPVAPAGPDGGGGAVPTRVEALPSHLDTMNEDGTGPLPAETDLALGQGSVVFVTESGQVVLVGAADGGYHLLDLPGLPAPLDVASAATADNGVPVALSPDGRRLAWVWNETPPVDRPVRGGIRVADLGSGDVHTVQLRGGEGVAASALSWSPDGHWLAFHATVARSWTEYSFGTLASRVDRLDTRTWRHVVVPRLQGERPVVDDRGRVSFMHDGLRRWDGRRTTLVGRPRSADVGVQDGMGDVVVAGPAGPDGSVPLASYGPGRGLLLRGGARDAWYPLPQDAYPAGGVVRVMGWMDATHPVALVRKALDASSAELEGRLLVLGDGEPRLVSTFDKAYPETFSVATDLVRPGHLSEEFPAPDWPWSPERKALVWGGAVAALLVLLLAARRVLRRSSAG